MSGAIFAALRTLKAGVRMGAGVAPFVMLLAGVAPLAAQAPDSIENRATLEYTDANGKTGSMEARALVHMGGGGSLPGRIVLHKLVDRTDATPGDTLVYTLRWNSVGPGGLPGFTLTDTLPSSVSFVTGSVVAKPQVLTTAFAGVLRFSLGAAAAGDSGFVRFAAVVRDSAGQAVNYARAQYDSAGTSRESASDTVRTRIETPDIRLELVALTDHPLHVGDTLTYRLRLTNGSSRLSVRDVTVSDSLPAEVRYIGAEPAAAASSGGATTASALGAGEGWGGGLHWQFDMLAPSATIEILVHTVVMSVGSGQIVSTATAQGSGVSRALVAVATVLVEEPAALTIRKTASTLEAASGDAVGYTIRLENKGGTRLDGVVVRDLMDPGLRLQDGTVTGATLSRSGGELVLSVGTLERGDSATIQYVTSVVGARADALGNRAWALAAGGLRTDTARVVVRLRDAAMQSRIVLGKAWLDENGDGRQQPAEAPLSHAIVWSSQGETARADSLGRFTFPDLRPGRYTFRVDPLSVPAGYLAPRPLSVRLDGWTSPVLTFALRRAPAATVAAGRPDAAGVAAGRSLSSDFLLGENKAAPGLRLMSPTEGSVLATNRLFVRVQGDAGAAVKVFLDSAQVAGSVLRPDGSEDFIGIEIRPGPHLVRALTTGAGGAQETLAHVHVSGEPRRVQRSDTAVVRAGREQVLAFRVLDEWNRPVAQQPRVTVEGEGLHVLEADADAFSVGRQVAVGPEGLLLARVRGDSAGSARLKLSFEGRDTVVTVPMLPEIRSLVLLADGEIGAGAAAASYGSAVARGALDSRTAITLSYDSRRTSQDAFAGTFDPLGESRQPVLGDASERTVLGSTTMPLSLRIERDRGWLTVGDLSTRGFGDDNSPGAYSRSLPGVSGQWLGGPLTLIGFGSSVSQQIVQKQLRGNGTSGPYSFGGTVRLGTDRLAIEARDRLNASLVLSRQELERYVDYDIDAETGTILLRRPLLSTDASGNPLMLVAQAEQIGGPSAFVGGLRAQFALTPFGAANDSLRTDSIRLGGAYIEDQSALGGHKLYSADLGASAHWGGSRFEVARGENGDSAGTAWRATAWAGAVASTGATLEWSRVGDGFANPANRRLVAGSEDLRFAGRAALGKVWTLNGGYSRQWFRAQAAERGQATLGVARTTRGNKLSLELGLLDDRLMRDSLNPSSSSSWSARLGNVVGRSNSWIEARGPMPGSDASERRSSYGVGTSYDLGHGVRAEASHRIVRSDTVTAAMSTLGLKTELSTGTRLWTEYDLPDNGSGQRSAALVGIGQKLRLTKQWSIDGQYERRAGVSGLPETDPARALPFAQAEPDHWSAALGTEWTAGARARLSLRGELGDNAQTGRSYRIFGGGEATLTPAWTLLAREDSRESRQVLTEGTIRTRASQSILAAAFRPARHSDWNALFKLEWRNDENPQRNAGAMLPGSDQRVIGAVETIWTPVAGSEIGARYALRRALVTGLLANDEVIGSVAHYAGGRVRQQLTDRLDLRATTRLLAEHRSGLLRWDAASALGLRLIPGLDGEAGYRFGDLRDADFARSGGHGFYASLGMSLTETAGQTLADFWRTRIARNGE